ncbi:MAG: nucleotidyltransferase family protein [Candidatus Binataceae bacterium]
MTPEIDGILLAAGESRRMGYPKPLLKIGDQLFVQRTAATILAVAGRLVIVLGAHAGRIRREIPADERIVVAENPDYLRGQLSSLKVGLARMRSAATAVIVHLGDHPLVTPATFRAIIDGYARSGKPIVIARHGGRRGHPVLFDRSVFAELAAAPEDEGARVIVNADPARIVYIDVDDPGVVLDLDTPADLKLAGLPPPPVGE